VLGFYEELLNELNINIVEERQAEDFDEYLKQFTYNVFNFHLQSVRTVDIEP
jgi:hypothetical protein